MSKHTPGPWYSIRLGNGGVSVDSKPGAHDHEVICVPHLEANAHLIASAPELLEAAKFALISLSAAAMRLGDDNLYASARAELREAIAKAEGRES